MITKFLVYAAFHKEEGRIMCQETSTRLADICREAAGADADLPVQAVLALFQEDPERLLVAVLQEGSYLGSVSRKELLNLLSRPFAMELYCKKPVTTLLGDLKGLNIAFPPQVEINAAAVALLCEDPTLQTDAFPLVIDGRCVGVVTVSDLMMAVAEQQRELLGKLDRLSSRIREEVARGVKIQQDLLPPPEYSFGALTVGAGIATCSEIGGDFYDYFSAGKDVLGLLIADVSGHGVQSGMVTTAAKASLHTLVSLGVTTPSGLIAGMNNAILATARRTLLMTCLIATIDLAQRKLTVANAGHNFPFVLRNGADRAEMLDTLPGFPLGFERDTVYPETVTGFDPGDTLFLYTDGIVESTNPTGEEFGYDRLQELLVSGQEVPPSRLHDFLLGHVTGFTGSEEFNDDVTTLVARFGSGGKSEKEMEVNNVAVLYLDDEDRNFWESTLSTIPGLVRLAAGDDPSAALDSLRTLRSALKVVILSASLYGQRYPALADLVRDASPGVEIMLLCCEDCAPPVKRLMEDRLRHLTIAPGNCGGCGGRDDYLPTAISMLVEQRPWELASCLKEGTAVHSYRLSSSEDKEFLIAKLEEVLCGGSEEMELLRQKGALLADELLENAMYNAPRGSRGDRLFNKGERREMLPEECILFSFGFDGETLALNLTDNWGSLEPEEVLAYLARNEEEATDDSGGRGLFIIWRFLDRFHVSVAPGQRTTVGGQLQLSSKLDPETPRGFHITRHHEEIAA